MRILLTNDDGWDAPGLAVLKSLAAELGEVFVIAPRDHHSYAGHRVTTDAALHLEETSPREFHLSGTPADCVRVALTHVFPDVDWVLAGINRGGNLGVDMFTSGTVAAAREAALLGRPALAISQYLRQDLALNWEHTREMARPVIQQLMAEGLAGKSHWNVNLPHLEMGVVAPVVRCQPDNLPLDVRFQRDGNALHYSGTYRARPFTPDRDIDHCFRGAITVSRVQL